MVSEMGGGHPSVRTAFQFSMGRTAACVVDEVLLHDEIAIWHLSRCQTVHSC